MTPWRSLPRPGDENEGRPPRPVGDSLDVVASHLGAPPARALGLLFERWADLVGPAIAAHSRPVSLVRGKLVVSVDQPGWAAQLNWLEADLLHRFAEGLGDGVVTALAVRVHLG